MTEVFNADQLVPGDRVVDLAGQPCTYIGPSFQGFDEWGVFQYEDGSLNSRPLNKIFGWAPEKTYEVRVTVTKEQVEAGANFQLGSPVNPYVVACKEKLEALK